MFKQFLIPLVFSLISSSCVITHRVQLADIDQSFSGTPQIIEVLVNEVGVNTAEIASTARLLSRNKQTASQIKELEQIISLFQWGPRTGNLTYVRDYADPVLTSLVAQCPSGKITNVLSVREMNKYPIVSGEIVKVKALCYK